MSGPFSNADCGEMFTFNRCARCRHRGWIEGPDDPCDAFTPAYLGEWPDILYPVPITEANPVGVECKRFEAEEVKS